MQLAEMTDPTCLPLTVEQVAEITRVTKQTVYGWIRTGRLRGMKAGRRWLTTRGELERFILSSTEGIG